MYNAPNFGTRQQQCTERAMRAVVADLDDVEETDTWAHGVLLRWPVKRVIDKVIDMCWKEREK